MRIPIFTDSFVASKPCPGIKISGSLNSKENGAFCCVANDIKAPAGTDSVELNLAKPAPTAPPSNFGDTAPPNVSAAAESVSVTPNTPLAELIDI